MKQSKNINKEKVTEKMGKSLVKIATKIATIDANTACPYITFQPHKPDEVKRLRKF